MATNSGNLDPLVILMDNSGNVLAIADDSDGSYGAVIANVQVPEDSFYFVVATRFGHGLGVTEGTFELSLQRVGVLSEAGVYLKYGDSVVGEIDEEHPIVEYVFEAQRGDIVNIHMQRISGNLDSYVAISAESGDVIIANDDRTGSLDAEIEDFLVLEPGLYSIIASRFGGASGTSKGSFVLTLETAPTSGLGLTPDAALLLRYGEELRGMVNDESLLQYYTFGARRGDIVTISLNRASGNLDPLLVLLDPNQMVLQDDDDSGSGNNALLQSVIIPETGTYYIQATRFDLEAGTTSGDYIIRLEGVTGEVPVVEPGTLTILYDSSVTATIDDTSSVFTYAFLAAEGDVITISMSKMTGDLDPLVLLFSADSTQLAEDDDSGPGKDAQIRDYVMPADGIYYILATRFEYQDGDTSGQYRLSLDVQGAESVTAP